MSVIVPVATPSGAVVANVICVLLAVSTRASPLSAEGVAPSARTTACPAKLLPALTVAVAIPPETETLSAVVVPQPVTSSASSAAIRHPGVLPLMTDH